MKNKKIESVLRMLQQTDFAFPFDVMLFNAGKQCEHIDFGMTLLDYFAGQYMAAGKLPDEAFRLARLAMKERGSDG